MFGFMIHVFIFRMNFISKLCPVTHHVNAWGKGNGLELLQLGLQKMFCATDR